LSEEHRYQHQCNADLATRAMLRQEGRELEQERIIKLLEPHRITGKSVGGFLGVCFCGEAMDDYQEHLLALIKGEK
jgi:hypothetical protein